MGWGDLDIHYHNPVEREVILRLYKAYGVFEPEKPSLGSWLGASPEDQIDEIGIMSEKILSISKALYNKLEAIRTGAYYDMYSNLNGRKAGLDSEAIVLNDGFNEQAELTPDEVSKYHNWYSELYTKFVNFDNLMDKIISSPNEYITKFKQPTLWENFLDMFLKQPLASAAGGASEALWSLLPVAAIGIGLLWLYYKVKK